MANPENLRSPESGGLNREEIIKQFDTETIPDDVLDEALKQVGKEGDYDFESMSDDDLKTLYAKAMELSDAGSGSAEGQRSSDPERNDNSEDAEKKKKQKKVCGKRVAAFAGLAAVTGIAALGVTNWASDKLDEISDLRAQLSAQQLENEDGLDLQDVENEDDDGDVDSTQYESKEEAMHAFGEYYENISEASTYHGHFANEDGTDYNKDGGKTSDYAFDVGYEHSDDEEYLKDQMCEALVQPGVLAVYYSETDKATAKAGNEDWGVADLAYEDENDLEAQIMADSELHQKVYEEMFNAIQEGSVENGVLEAGNYDNYYFDADFSKGDIDATGVEIVGQTTYENGTKVLVLTVSWTGGSASIKAKEACKQIVTEEGGTIKLRQVDPGNPGNPGNPGTPVTTTVPNTPNTTPKTPPNTKTPPETPETPDDSKNAEAINQNAGGNVSHMSTGDKTDGHAGTEDSDGDGVNDADEFNQKDGNDGSAGGKSGDTESAGGGTIQDMINETSTNQYEQETQRTDENASEAASEAAAEAERQKEESAADSKANEMENKDRDTSYDTNGDNVTSMDELFTPEQLAELGLQ